MSESTIHNEYEEQEEKEEKQRQLMSRYLMINRYTVNSKRIGRIIVSRYFDKFTVPLKYNQKIKSAFDLWI